MNANTNVDNYLNGPDATNEVQDDATEQELETAIEETLDGPTGEIAGTVQTELFDLNLKTVQIGNNVIDATKGTLGLQLMRTLTHKLADIAAGRMIDCQAELFDAEMVIERECPLMSDTFDDAGHVMDDYAEGVPEASVVKAETLNAEFTIIMMTLGQMAEEKARLFPHDQMPLSYAYDQQAQGRDRFITDLVEGISYRAKEHDSLQALRAQKASRPGMRQHSRKLPKTYLQGI